MCRSLLLAALLLLAANGQAPKGDLPRFPPKSPAEALKAIVVAPGFRVELAAAEPLVQSPMACDWDEDGRLFVVELPEYNDYAATRPHGKGRIVCLEDTDGNGLYDKRTVFASDLKYPTGLICWNGGLYVGAAPDLLYLKDTDGDGKADTSQVILTGFGTDKAGEGQLNSFRWTLDNRIRISSGLDGGDLKGPDGKLHSIRSRDILLDPRNNSWELTSGGGQHGHCLDDWGRVLVSGNSDPIHMLAYDARYLADRPNVQAPAAAVNILPSGKFTKLHRISETEPWRAMRTKLRKEGAIPGYDEGGTPSGFFTGATGVTVYRGDAFPPAYRGNIFVGEVANNLLFRATLKPNGSLLLAERADPDREFLASKDVWFRPVQLANAPDGCLYVLDMSRELIEGAAFLAPQVLKNVDPSAGIDMGRIWRIVPEGHKRRPMPKLSQATTAELVALLDHPNGWHRDTASRLLYQRQDKAAIEPLKKMATGGRTGQGRLHALCSLASTNQLELGPKREALRDSEPRVREQAVRLFLGSNPTAGNTPFKLVLDLRNDVDINVRKELAFSLGRVPSREPRPSATDKVLAAAYVQLAIKDVQDAWIRLAILAGMSQHQWAEVLRQLTESREFLAKPDGSAFLIALAEIMASDPSGAYADQLLRSVTALASRDSATARAIFRAVRLRSSQRTLNSIDDPNFAPAVKALTNRLIEDAVRTARDTHKTPEARSVAIRDLQIVSFKEAVPILKETLEASQPPAVQQATLDVLGRFGDDSVPDLILSAWPAMSPQVRATATEILLSRGNWIPTFLDAVEGKKVARADVDPARVALLKKNPARNIGVRASKLFAAPADRQKVFEDYRKALDLKGDLAKGKAVFKANCSACHKLEGVGTEVGADLKAIRDRGLDGVLLAIVDPNREVKPQYLAYLAELKNGRQITGMITADTPTGITIRRADGTSEDIRRSDIDSLRSLGSSYMPEGLEKQIDVAAMADLLTYLNSIR